MFDLALSEVVVVAVVALLTLGPKEMVSALRSLRNIKHKLGKLYRSTGCYISNILDEEQNVVDVMIDEHGKCHKMYDVKSVMPSIKDKNE